MGIFSRLKYILFVFIFASLTCFTQALIQNDKGSEITFKIRNFGFNVSGNFSDFTILSNFNSGNLKERFINVEISVNSIFTDSKSRDAHLLKADFFDVKKYPKIGFKSTEIVKITGSKYLVKGFLIIKGIKKRVETPFEIKETKASIIMLANFTLNRKDFGVGGSSFVLSKKVNIKMKYVANKN